MEPILNLKRTGYSEGGEIAVGLGARVRVSTTEVLLGGQAASAVH